MVTNHPILTIELFDQRRESTVKTAILRPPTAIPPLTKRLIGTMDCNGFTGICENHLFVLLARIPDLCFIGEPIGHYQSTL